MDNSITVRELYEYSQCPNFFKYKRINKLKSAQSVDELFEQALLSSIKASLMHLMSSGSISYKFLVSRWDRSWWDSKKTRNILKEEDMGKYATRAALYLKSFYSIYLEDDRFVPIAVNLPYALNFIYDDFNLNVKGHQDVLLIDTKTKKTKLIMICPQSRSMYLPGDYYYLNSYLAMHAYTSLDISKSGEEEIIIYSVFGEKEKYLEYDAAKIKKIEKEVYGMYAGILNKVYYPRSSSACSSCAYRLNCTGE